MSTHCPSIELFKQTFKGEIVTSSDADYKQSISRWAKNAERPAKLVAFAMDSEDVALAVRFAVAEKLPISIRGGGHNVSGASSSNGGIVIDLSRHLNDVRIDAAKKLVYVGGGALWRTVDKEAIKYGLATVAGTVNHTGVGGLALGGGYGWLSGEHGLVIDNTFQVTMILADGTTMIANQVENTDLFWGVRGGGSNFGICTEFVFRLHEQRKTVYSGTMTFPAPNLVPLLKATQEWWEKGPSEKEGMFLTMTRGPHPERNPCILVTPFYNGSEIEGRKVFKFLADLNPADDQTKELPFEALNELLNEWELIKETNDKYMRGVTQAAPNLEVGVATFEKMVDLTLSKKEYKAAIIFEYFPLTKINSVGHETMAFSKRNMNQNVLGLCAWDRTSPESQVIGRELCHALTDVVASFQKDLDESKHGGYGNYESDELSSSDRAIILFGSKYPKLQQLKRKYDPDMVFKKWMPITPA